MAPKTAMEPDVGAVFNKKIMKKCLQIEVSLFTNWILGHKFGT